MTLNEYQKAADRTSGKLSPVAKSETVAMGCAEKPVSALTF